MTSAYLLAYAVPLLITGRLGDRFGPKNIYLIGLVVFTLASLWCGLSGTIGMLIVARVVQGLGAALMTPQTMAVITRIFPPDRRGAAMGLWGAVAGVATLVGPILGGVLVDGLGWEWIFFINVPVGIVGFVLAWRLVPTLPTHAHRFDILGVVLVGGRHVPAGVRHPGGRDLRLGRHLGPDHRLGADHRRRRSSSAAFVWWQATTRRSRCCRWPCSATATSRWPTSRSPRSASRHRAWSLPLIFYFQIVRGLTPTQSALMLVPMAVVSAGARAVRRQAHRQGATRGSSLSAGCSCCRAGAVLVLACCMHPDTRIWLLLLPAAARARQRGHVGADRRHRDPQPAAAAGGRRLRRLQHDAPDRCRARDRPPIAALMEAGSLPSCPPAGRPARRSVTSVAAPRPVLHAGFSHGDGPGHLLPAAVLLLGVLAAAFFARPGDLARHGGPVQVGGQTKVGRHAASAPQPSGASVRTSVSEPSQAEESRAGA